MFEHVLFSHIYFFFLHGLWITNTPADLPQGGSLHHSKCSSLSQLYTVVSYLGLSHTKLQIRIRSILTEFNPTCA